MKKRILSLLLAVLLLLPSLLLSASAAPTGRIDGVDYGRIDENVNLRMKVEFDIGERRFEGWLQNGKTLSEQEVDKIIKTVMNEMEITSGVLRYSEEIIRKAAQNRGFNPDVVLELGAKLALSATGLDKAKDIYDIATGQKTIPGAISDYIIGESVSTICEQYMKGIPGMVFEALWNSGDIIARETARLLEESKIAQQALERTFLLNLFYQKCNERIEAEEKAKGLDTWSIVCNQTVWCQQTLFEIPVLQYWKLSCDLTRTDFIYGDDDDPTNYGGVYRGTMVIDIWHDLSNFDEQFMSKILSTLPWLPPFQAYTTMRDDYKASSLTKQLICTNVEIHLDRDNMTSGGMTEYFMLRDFSDTSSFIVNHGIIGPLHFGPFDNGKWIASYPTENGTVHVNLKEEFNHYFSGTMTNGNRYPQILFAKQDYMFTGTIIAPYLGNIHEPWTHQSTPNFPVLTDYKIFEDLRGGRGMLTVVGK